MGELPEHLDRKILQVLGCWIWTGAVKKSYGIVYSKSKQIPAHRVVYEALVGPIPDGLVIDHLCRNRLCVNPAHLEPVTNIENVMRGNGIMARKKRQMHCVWGHELTQSNVRLNKYGRRECKTCVRRRSDEWKANKSKAAEAALEVPNG